MGAKPNETSMEKHFYLMEEHYPKRRWKSRSSETKTWGAIYRQVHDTKEPLGTVCSCLLKTLFICFELLLSSVNSGCRSGVLVFAHPICLIKVITLSWFAGIAPVCVNWNGFYLKPHDGGRRVIRVLFCCCYSGQEELLKELGSTLINSLWSVPDAPCHYAPADGDSGVFYESFYRLMSRFCSRMPCLGPSGVVYLRN